MSAIMRAPDPPERPFCKDCSQLATVIMIRSPGLSKMRRPYCDDHIPDPDDYGNSKWEGSVVIERFDRPIPPMTIYGTLGGEKRTGRTMHILNPATDETVCHCEIEVSKRYCLSETLADDHALCGACLAGKFGGVREELDETYFEAFIKELRRIADREGELRNRAMRDSHIEYPGDDSRINHACSEGVDKFVDILRGVIR